MALRVVRWGGEGGREGEEKKPTVTGGTSGDLKRGRRELSRSRLLCGLCSLPGGRVSCCRKNPVLKGSVRIASLPGPAVGVAPGACLPRALVSLLFSWDFFFAWRSALLSIYGSRDL